MDKIDILSTNSDDNIDPILCVIGEDKDPNFQDVQSHDRSNYLRERHWIKQASPIERWKNSKLFNMAGSTELRLSDLGRKLDDPGDAFYELFLFTHRYDIHLRTWFEVTEVFLPGQAKMVNRFIRNSNGLQGKEKFDADQFKKSINLGIPDVFLQNQMVDNVIESIKKKANKGRQEGSYKSLVNDYGRGQLIVGLPLWSATFPVDLMDSISTSKNFFIRLKLALNKIKHSVLLKKWCPFDSVIIIWNPTLEAIDEWIQIANKEFYTDPANISMKRPFSFIKAHDFLKKLNLLQPPLIKLHVRWDRYSSLNSMLRNQRRWLRFPNNPRPLGPKACFTFVKSKQVTTSLRLSFYLWPIMLLLYIRTNGLRGLLRRIVSMLSVKRLYSFIRLKYQIRKLYRSSSSNCSMNNDNDRAD